MVEKEINRHGEDGSRGGPRVLDAVQVKSLWWVKLKIEDCGLFVPHLPHLPHLPLLPRVCHYPARGAHHQQDKAPKHNGRVRHVSQNDMKRRQTHDKCTKKPRKITTLCALPQEIVHEVLRHLPLDALKLLACTSREVRRLVSPALFRCISTTWEQLVGLTDFAPRGAVRQLRIRDASSYNEYQQSFSILLSRTRFPHLQSVLVNLVNSSHWLKYNAGHFLALKMYSAEPISPRVFSIAHVHKFPLLRRLALEFYHFDWTNNVSVHLEELLLVNCTWEYPFNLDSFNTQGLLRTLDIAFSHNHDFVLSERFGDFLQNPLPATKDSVHAVSLLFVNTTRYRRHLTPQILRAFCGFASLALLTFDGWTVNLAHLQLVTLRHPMLTLRMRVDVLDSNKAAIANFGHWARLRFAALALQHC